MLFRCTCFCKKSDKIEKGQSMNMDRISCLPNSIICEILSYLSTKEAVSTSILSRSWRHIWKDLQVFDIHDWWLSQEGRVPFDYVNAILAQRNADSYPIEKFRLTCDYFHQPIFTWFDVVIGPHLQELYLCMHVTADENKLPVAIFTLPSLKSLVLEGWINLDYYPEFPDVYLPSLKNLELEIDYVEPGKLLSGCPVLENLKLMLRNAGPEYGDHVYVPTIQMPRTLKSLTLLDLGYMLEEINHRVIETPSLEYLHITKDAMNPSDSKLHFSFSYFPNMVEAHLDIYHELVEPVNWVAVLLQALRETKLLTLTNRTTLSLFIAPAFEFPEFHRMLNLDIHVPCFNTNFLLNFLHNCPVLESLVIDIAQFTKAPEYNGPTPPTTVPKCVTSHLKSFEVRGYQDDADEHEFIACVLQRGVVLKTMTIKPRFGFTLKTKYDIVKGLCAIPRGSSTCQLKFIDHNLIYHG